MKRYLIIFATLSILSGIPSTLERANTSRIGVERSVNRLDRRQFNNRTENIKNIARQKPEVKIGNMTTTRGISEKNMLERKHKTSAANNNNIFNSKKGKQIDTKRQDQSAGKSMSDRQYKRYSMSNKSKIFITDKPTVEKRNVIISKSNDTTAHTTTVEARNVSTARIEYKLLKKPHNLFIGRCYPKKYPVLHQENVIVTNDEKSHVTAKIKMIVAGDVYITCANVYDQGAEGEESYPTYSGGGVGRNFIEFDVLTQYGKGFKVFVQIFGYRKDEISRDTDKQKNISDSVGYGFEK